jgi:membrane protein implicated in regulation of membrane protease activity
MSSPEDNPRRVSWTWRAIGALVAIAAFLLLLNLVYRSGNQILALAILAVALVVPGAWQLRRSRTKD